MSEVRFCYLSPPEMHRLDIACVPLKVAFGTPYLVGSVNTRRDYRDVDVRLILDDDDPVLADGPRVRALNFALSEYLRAMTGLPVDFQFQSMTAANSGEHEGFRNPLGLRWDPRLREQAGQ